MEPTEQSQRSGMTSEFSQCFCNVGLVPNAKHRRKGSEVT
ncbi:rCG38794 [Rattus norvegicus]|uniref:RCG38794 n=1 Tax=Rattus norvegicus TaxID=10116 RepID=A6K9K1_RAT|nr:rCG38794 [Rattus norvegicus]